MSVKVNALDHLVINVADVARSAPNGTALFSARRSGCSIPAGGKSAADIAGVPETKRSMCGHAM